MRLSPPVLPPQAEPIIRRNHRVRKPNYQFEKRRRDLEKKAKNEEKRLRKLEKSTGIGQSQVAEPVAEEGSDPKLGGDDAACAPEVEMPGSAS